MIDSGAQLEAFDVYFGPPLHIACAKAHVDCVKELLYAGQQEDDRSEKVLKCVSNFLHFPQCHQQLPKEA